MRLSLGPVNCESPLVSSAHRAHPSPFVFCDIARHAVYRFRRNARIGEKRNSSEGIPCAVQQRRHVEKLPDTDSRTHNPT